MTASSLEPLTLEECVARLESHEVGRIAFVVDEFPIILPVNYRLVTLPGKHWIAIRTRRGGLIQSASFHAAFEIDDIEPTSRSGWSVVARGTLHPVDPVAAGFSERFAPDSWVVHGEEAWMVIEAFQITGRRAGGSSGDWKLDLGERSNE